MSQQFGLGEGIPGMVGYAESVMAVSKKQKLQDGQALASSCYDENMSDDDEGMKKGGSKQTTEAKRFQHCEVEKRRRERMNRYMSELAQMIPACNAVPRRLDKLSILKMAVDHMKNLRGDPHSSSEYKPGFLTDDELKQLVVEAANGFMLIIECSMGRILFVSDTIAEVLNESEDDWMGSCFYDLLHPKDIQKVKEQLVCFDVEEALKASIKQSVSSSPLLMHSQSMNGLRRSFLCRVKRTGTSQPTREIASAPDTQQLELARRDYNRSEDVIKLIQSTQQSTPYQYAVLHCTGFIRNLTNAERQSLRVEESSSGACLVAVARLQHFGESVPRATMETNENEFVARVGVDGRFTYVDPRVAGVLGYLPQDLMGQVSYEYYHPEDIQKMVQLHNDAMKRRTPMPTVQYRFLGKNQKWVWLAMKAFSFVNPFSQQVEYVVCTNVTMRSPTEQEQPPTTVQQAEQQLQPKPALLPAQEKEEDTLTTLLAGDLNQPGMPTMMQTQPTPMQQPMQLQIQPTPISTAAPVTYATPLVQGSVFTIPSTTTLEENAATAQRFLEEYQRMNVTPPLRKDMNYEFPPGLFTTEVDLAGSQLAYRNLLLDLDNPEDFEQLFEQIEADPFRAQNIFEDIDLECFQSTN